ncbi:protein-glutamine gamma-glutamyltransferase [Oceanobacillus saliphilus]|uniref:protein-glutamine gamma-glutamyltransferase n=1 Tax=Oceanobacillus saliphilus TaxID=2925834 RepID=UPI00201E1047|nr:protein-glutamine gamma-glutamyltransferase [Oceanobacillus saliphilus]
MIQVSGMVFQQSDKWLAGSIESVIIQRMMNDPAVYSYPSIDELEFELKLRKNIIASARAMNQGDAQFESFENSRCNPDYWHLTSAGGFRIRQDVLPSAAIQDIFTNSSLYAYECAVAKVIIFYHAVLNTINEHLFNQLFQNLYLYSWNADPDLGIQIIDTLHFLPGDVVYFNNPDFNPATSWWRGENAVDLGDGTYFGHGIGIRTAEQMIQALNEMRRPGSIQSAYLLTEVARPSFNYLARLSLSSRSYHSYKVQHAIIHHHESSISCKHYLFYLDQFYLHISNTGNPI